MFTNPLAVLPLAAGARVHTHCDGRACSDSPTSRCSMLRHFATATLPTASNGALTCTPESPDGGRSAAVQYREVGEGGGEEDGEGEGGPETVGLLEGV